MESDGISMNPSVQAITPETENILSIDFREPFIKSVISVDKSPTVIFSFTIELSWLI